MRTTPYRPETEPAVTLAVVAVVSAAAWWAIGFLPWIAGGLEGTGVAGERVADTRIGVPLYLGSFALLIVFSLVGGVVSGFASRLGAGRPGLLAPQSRLNAAAASFAGVTAALALALVQSARAVDEVARGAFATDGRLANALILTVAGTTLAGWVVGALASAHRAVLGPAVGLLAGAFPFWAGELVAGVAGTVTDAATALSWGRAALLACALVLVGASPLWRLLLWPVTVLAAWVMWPLVNGTSFVSVMYEPGSGTLGGTVSQAWEHAWLSLTHPVAQPLETWVAPLVLAVLVTLRLAVRARNRVSREDSDELAESPAAAVDAPSGPTTSP